MAIAAALLPRGDFLEHFAGGSTDALRGDVHLIEVAQMLLANAIGPLSVSTVFGAVPLRTFVAPLGMASPRPKT